MNTALKTGAAFAAMMTLMAGNAAATCTITPSHVVIPKNHTVDLSVTCDAGERFSSIDWLRDTTSASGGAGFPVSTSEPGPFGYRVWDKLEPGTYVYKMTGTLAAGGSLASPPEAQIVVIGPVVASACGTSAGVLTHNAPSGGLCAAGTASGVSTSASAFTWTCTGSDAGNTACQAPRGYNITTATTNGAVSPSGTILTPYRGTKTFTLTPTSGSAVVATGAGQCGGVFSGGGNTSYTTQPITADCAVTVNFTAVSGATCGADNGTLQTATPTALCSAGTPSSVTTTAGRYDWSCTGVGNPTPTATCYANRGYTVTASAGAGGSISPASRTVAYNSSTTFTVTPNFGYVAGATSTCGGALSGTTFTTNAVVANCTVTATFESGVPVTDPGMGTLWTPPGYPNLLVADQMNTNGAGTMNYIPGCINHTLMPTSSATGCAANDFYEGTAVGYGTYNFKFLQGNILSLRVTANSPQLGTGFFRLQGADGGNLSSSVSIWLATDPRTSYAATATGCKDTINTSTNLPTFTATCPLTAGVLYYVNIMVNDANHCGLSSQCRMQLQESTDVH